MPKAAGSQAPAAGTDGVRPISNGNMGLLMLSHVFNDGYGVLLLPFLPIFASDFHLGAVGAGGIMTAFAVSAALFQLPLAMLADVNQRRKLVLCAGLVVSATAVMLYGRSPSYEVLLAIAFIGGIGASTYHPAALALVAAGCPPERRGFFIGIFNTTGTFGMAVVPLVAGLLAVSIGWRAALTLFGPIVLVIAVILYVVFPDPRRAAGVRPVRLKDTITAVFANRNLMRLVTASTLRGFSWKGIQTFLPLLLAQVYGWNTAAVAAGVFSLSIAGVFAQPLVGALGDRFGRWPIIAVVLSATGLLAPFFIVGGSPWLLYPLMAAWGGLSISLRPLYIAQVTDVVDAEHHASGIGANFVVTQGMGAIAPIVGGVIASVWSLQVVFPFFAVCMLASLVPARRAFQRVPLAPRAASG